MRLSALKHLIEVTLALAHPQSIHVLGSSALLASFPELGEPGQPLELSFDADFLIEPCDEHVAAMLHEAVGEGSLFAQRTGYHADFLRPEITESFPESWRSSLVRIGEGPNVAALSPEDVAAVKLRLGRPKDIMICSHLISHGLVTAEAIRQRLNELALSESEVVQVFERLRKISS